MTTIHARWQQYTQDDNNTRKTNTVNKNEKTKKILHEYIFSNTFPTILHTLFYPSPSLLTTLPPYSWGLIYLGSDVALASRFRLLESTFCIFKVIYILENENTMVLRKARIRLPSDSVDPRTEFYVHGCWYDCLGGRKYYSRQEWVV